MTINKTYKIRFVKLPPAAIVFGKPFEIIFSLTDDLGLELPYYPDTEIALQVEASEPLSSLYHVEDSLSKSASVVINSSRSLLHKRTLRLYADPRSRTVKAGQAYLLLKLADQRSKADSSVLTPEDRALMQFVNVKKLLHLPEEEVVGLVVPTFAGPFSVIASKSGDHSALRVSTTEVLLSHEQPVRIIERPLDNIIGDHLWHGSVILANLILEGGLSIPKASNIIELGAGCGLVSLAIEQALKGELRRIIATDLSEVVESTLKATLDANAKTTSSIQMQSLEWASSEDTARLLQSCQGRDSLWLVAADVLYNPDSHEVLLQTIRNLCQSFGQHTITIAYRPRALGDYDFFALAEGKGYRFKQVTELADVQIWQYSNIA